MAPPTEALYFPVLDKCLKGEQPVISWKAAYRALRDLDAKSPSISLQHFLRDEETQNYLTHPFSAFGSPSSKSKSDFETKTAAINVVPSNDGHYDIEELKVDAQWLSKEVNVSENVALRVVMVEWQERAKARLMTQWSEEEVHALESLTAGQDHSALGVIRASQIASSTGNKFDSEAARRTRILETYFSEKCDLLKTAEALAGVAQPPHLHSPNSLYGRQRTSNKTTLHAGIADCAKTVWEGQCRPSSEQSPVSSFLDCVEGLKARLSSLEDIATWPKTVGENEYLVSVFVKSLHGEIISVLRLALLHVRANTSIADGGQVLAWFELMDEHMFLAEIAPVRPDTAYLVDIMHCLVSLVSTAIIGASQALEYIQTTYMGPEKIAKSDVSSKPYLESEDCVKLLTGTLLGAASQLMRHAGPPVLAWSIVAQNLRDAAVSTRSDTPRQLEDGSSDSESPVARQTSFRTSTTKRSRPEILVDLILDIVPGEDTIALMGTKAVNELGVFEIITSVSDLMLDSFIHPLDIHTLVSGKLALFELVREATPLLTYGTNIVQAVLSTMVYDSKSLAWPSEPARTLLSDTYIIGPRLMEVVTERYPHETGPLLFLLATLSKSIASVNKDGSLIVTLLDNMPCLTSEFPANFDSYDLVQEEEMVNCIRLSAPLSIFVPKRNRGFGTMTDRKEILVGSVDSDSLQFIPAGTVGTVVRDTRPFVVRWHYPHSGLEYLGLLLSSRMSSTIVVEATSGQYLDVETTTTILGLLSSIIEATSYAEIQEEIRQLLGRLSNGLPRSDDIIRVVFEILEETLQEQTDRPGQEDLIVLLSEGVRFIRNIMQVYPERVWSFLSRSRLLAVNESSSALAGIVGATEVPLARFTFLRSCISLFETLVQDAMKRAVSRTAVVTRAVTRFQDPVASQASTPEKTMSLVLLAFQTILIDVFLSQTNWRFQDPKERQQLHTSILRALNNTLRYAYGLGDSDQDPRKITGCFLPAARSITDNFLGAGPQAAFFQPILDILISAAAAFSSTADTSDIPTVVAQSRAAVAVCDTILRVGMLLEQQGAALLLQLFQAVPILTRLYSADPSLRSEVAHLLTVMVQYANQQLTEPPSLLSHLSPDATKAFLAMIPQLDLPMNNLEVEVRIWDMLSAVVSSKQQWLAICLLTGSTPRDRLKDKDNKTADTSGKPLLTFALDHLVKIDSLAPRRAIAMLAFVSRAQNHWSWATNNIGAHPQFVSSMTEWLVGLGGAPKSADTEAAIRTANENQIAAFIADILATYLHGARRTSDTELVTKIAPKLSYLYESGAAVDGYNHSLHKNLSKNFGQKFPHCSLANFKRTSLTSADFGRDYYYDLDLADTMLDYEPSWSRGKSQGFVDEVARASVNLSLVESQIALLKSWKSLAIELSGSVQDNAHLQANLAKVVSRCLKSNMETSIPSMLFENVVEIRAELAFVLLQQLVNIQSTENQVRDLIYLSWDAVRTTGLDFDVISTTRDADHYRTLLQILFLSLQPHAYNPMPSSSSLRKSAASPANAQPLVKKAEGSTESALTSNLLEIVRKVAALNFRALCGSVHSSPEDSQTTNTSRPSDFVLLTAIFQTVLRIPSTAAIHQQIATIVADAGLIRYATSLYSWSDSIMPGPTDPLYGELSILFLLSLSTVPLVAEQMAVEGILSHLSAANISQHLRQQAGKSPFDTPARLHSIWTRGILPLCLNLLEHVGPGMASEISSFLNSFPTQLRRAHTDLEASTPSLRTPHAGSVTLALASETHSLCLIAVLVERLRAAGPAVGVVGSEIPSLSYDRLAVREELDGMLRGRRGLRERIVPLGEREVAWVRLPPKSSGGLAENLLEERLVAELEGARECLGVL